MSAEEQTVRELRRASARFQSSLSRTIKEEVLRWDTRALLTLRVRGLRYTPAASTDYAKRLYEYMNGDSATTSGIDDAISDAAAASCGELLRWCEQDDEFNRAVAEALASDAAFVTQAVRSVAEALDAEAPEVERGIGNAIEVSRTTPETAVGPRVGRQGSAVVVHAAMTVVITKTLGTPAIKAAIYHAAHSVAAATAARKAGLIAAKKAGVGLVLKALLVKLGVAIGAGHLAFIIALPVVALLLRHEWKSFPRKMADAVSTDLPPKLAAADSPCTRRSPAPCCPQRRSRS